MYYLDFVCKSSKDFKVLLVEDPKSIRARYAQVPSEYSQFYYVFMVQYFKWLILDGVMTLTWFTLVSYKHAMPQIGLPPLYKLLNDFQVQTTSCKVGIPKTNTMHTTLHDPQI